MKTSCGDVQYVYFCRCNLCVGGGLGLFMFYVCESVRKLNLNIKLK